MIEINRSPNVGTNAKHAVEMRHVRLSRTPPNQPFQRESQ